MDTHADPLSHRTAFGSLLLRTDVGRLDPFEARNSERFQSLFGHLPDDHRLAEPPAKARRPHRQRGKGRHQTDCAGTADELTTIHLRAHCVISGGWRSLIHDIFCFASSGTSILVEPTSLSSTIMVRLMSLV